MDRHRRRLVGAGIALAVVGLPRPAHAQAERLGGGADVTAELQREIDAAARRGRAFLMPAGTMNVARLRLHSGARLIGVRGETRMLLAGGGPLVIADGVGRVTLTGIVFDGAGRRLDAEHGLVDCTGVGDILVSDCIFQNAEGVALRLERCGGWIERSDIRDIAGVGICAVDATGLVLSDNIVQRCNDAGIQVRRATPGNDDTHIRGNRVLDIRTGSTAAGPSGNGVSLIRAAGVLVSGNTIQRCAVSAVRSDGCRDAVISGNGCSDLGETAILAEGGFEGGVVSGNVIDGAAAGIQLLKAGDERGRSAVCTGNIVRNLHAGTGQPGHDLGHGAGIKVETDVAVTGNLVDGAAWVGILAGWGAALRDVAITGNVVRGSPIGIGVSIARGAGGVVISGNAIAGATGGAIVGMELDKVVTADFAKGGPAPATLAISGNRAM